MLQYDDSAFYFFALSMLSFYLVPSWYSIISRTFDSFVINDEAIGAVTRTSAEQAKALALKKKARGISKLLKKKSFLVNLGITFALSLAFFWLIAAVSKDGEVQSFDPYAILEIDPGADIKTIKKAYHELAIKWHPDHNPGNRNAAEAMFRQIKAAKDALTDPTAMENMEKCGNPDCNQPFAFGFGLPSFLLESHNHNLVLVAYLFIVVVAIPFAVYTYYSDSRKYGEKDVMYDTYSWYHHTLSEHNASIKSLPEVLAGSAEFRKRNLPKTVPEKDAIGQVAMKVRSQMQKPKYKHPVVVKGCVLMHAHLLRKKDLLNEQLTDDLRYMLEYSTTLMDAMISVCKHEDWMQTAIDCIEFGQYVTQAMWIKDSLLLQLPHFTAQEITHCEKGKTKVKTIQEYRAQPDDEKRGMLNFTEAQKQDVMNYLKIFPDITVETRVFVDDDDDEKVYEGDLVTVQVVVTRNNLDKGEKAGLVHAPHFPFPKKEAWWIILGQLQQGKIISIEKIGNPNRKFESRIKFMAPPQGQYVFDLFVKSNAYIGCDYKTKVEMETLDNSTLPEYKVHPKDAELDDEPTLFEEMLNANIEQDSDEEDESDGDEEEDEAALRSVADKKKEPLRKARQVVVGDDDDDDSTYSDAEELYNKTDE